MIFTERTITVVNDSATINKPLILYRGDKNIELKITIAESQFKFRNTDASNVIETTDASYAQLVINTPYGLPIFSDVAATKNGAVIFVITEAMIDEIREVGAYEIQIRLLDDNKQSRASIPPVSNAIEIREPIAIEDGSAVDSNAVNTARVNRALTTTSAPLEAFDSQGNYIKKTWGDGDPITDAALNKMEAGIDGVNKKVATSIVVNGNTYTHSNGTITLPDYPIVGQPTQEQVNNAFKNVKCDSNYNNPFENLNIVLFGDSITDLENNNITKWVQPFRELITCKSFKNYARGYCTWTFKSDTSYNITDKSDANVGNNVIWNQFNKLKNDVNNGTVNTPDVIMILAGTNDALQSNALGDINTAFSSSSQGADVTQLTTLAQSVRYVCDEIYNTYPNCKIIICTPLPIGTASSYPKSVEVRNMLISCANVLNLDIIDQTYKSGIVWYREAQSNIYYRGDGVHLNDLGGELIANFIYKELLNLPCFYEKTVKSINLSTAPVTTYAITNNLSHATNSNSLSSITEGSSYTATIQISAGYTLDVIRITMGETDITNTVYSNGNISIPNVTGDIIITVTTTQSTSTVRNYLRDELVGTFTEGIWEDAVMIPDLAIPNTGEVVSFDCNSCINGDLYVFLATKSDKDFTPIYVKQCTLSEGTNSININYTPNDSIDEYYVGFKSVVRNTIGLNIDINSAASTNQQFTQYYHLGNSSYIPEVGKVINTQGIKVENIGLAFDCMLKVKA